MKRVYLVTGALVFLLIAGIFIGVSLGPVKLSIQELAAAITMRGDPASNTLVWDLRMPRVVAALIVGSCLGVAGCLLQRSTRNPLGDPQLFGLGGGAAVIQALAIAGLLTVGNWGLFALSVAASLIGAGAIVYLATKDGITPARLALIGVSLSVLATAAATGIMAEARVFSQQSLNFIGGSFANLGWQNVIPIVPFAAFGLLLALPVAGSLNTLALGDQIAANLGAEPGRTRTLAVASSGVLGGAAVAVAGLVGFIGLLVPHIARSLVGHDTRAILIVSIPLGAAITLYADQIARLAFMPSEVPVGMVTALLGAPLMIYVARKAF